jgi:chloride channel 3/4/5
MHITVSVVVIMFELTGALTYILPTMIVVGVTKAVGEVFSKGGIADRMIWFNGFPFLDNKEDHTFGVPVSQVMTSDAVSLPTSGLSMKDVEELLATGKYQGFPIVEDDTSKILVGYIGRTELRYAIDRVKKDRSISSGAKCCFSPPQTFNTSRTPASAVSTKFQGAATSAVDFSRFIDLTPVTVHPQLQLETVMEIFRKIGPRVILIEYYGKLAGLVTVKDCLKYQFKVEASENPRDDRRIAESHERLWGALKTVAIWLSDHINHLSRGRIRISSLSQEDPGLQFRGSASGPFVVMDGTEEIADDGALELEDR